MLTIFIVGSMWFWVLLAVEFLILLVLTETERPGWSFLSLLALGVLFKYFGDFDPFAWVVHNPVALLWYFAAYLVAGTIWSVIKWFFYVYRQKEKYIEAKSRYLNHRHLSLKDWEDSWDRNAYKNSKGGIVPLVGDNKGRIMMWMGYWPFSAVWTLIDEPVKKAFRMIYNRIHDTLQDISNNAFKGVN
jgi:hypothetical protein